MMNDELYEEGKRLLTEIKGLKPTSDEYKTIMARIKEINSMVNDNDRREAELGWNDRLNEAKLSESEAKLAEMSKPFYKKDGFIQALVSGATSIGGILIVTNFEKVGNLTSKALQFIKKPR